MRAKRKKKPSSKSKEGFICCLCKKRSYGWGKGRRWGNSPSPIAKKGECCDNCNSTKVIPTRIRIHREMEEAKQVKE